MNRKIERLIPFTAAAAGFGLTLAFYHPDQSVFQPVPTLPAVVRLTSVPQADPQALVIASAPEIAAQPAPAQNKARLVQPGSTAAGSDASAAANAVAAPIELASKEQKEQSEVPVTLRTNDAGGSVVNRTGEPLHLTVFSGQIRADVMLGPHEHRSLAEAGFAAQPGQKITVQSPPYKDLILQQ